MEVSFTAEVWSWRGPAPYHFVTVPGPEGEELKAIAALVTYGWGMIPVTARIGTTVWKTSAFPKDGGYIVPIKDLVRHANQLDVGDPVTIHLQVRPRSSG